MAIRLSNQGKGQAAYSAGKPGRALLSRPATTAPAAKPPPPAAPPPAPLANPTPIDPYYDAAVAAAQRDYAVSQQQSQYQMGQLGSVYGLGVNAQGGVYDDPSNPYSRAAAMQEAWSNQQRGNTTSMAARGQLYSGALQLAQDDSSRKYSAGRDALIRSFMNDRYNIQQGQLASGNSLQDRIAAAQADSFERAVNNRPDPASVPGGTTAPAATAAAPKQYTDKPGTDSKGNPGIWRTWTNGRKVFVKK